MTGQWPGGGLYFLSVFQFAVRLSSELVEAPPQITPPSPVGGGSRMLRGRVVSPEISSGKFPEIYSYFSRNFRKIAGTILQGIFLPRQTFQITAHLLPTMLLKGFYSTCGL